MEELKAPKKPLVYYYGIIILLLLFNFLVMPQLSERQALTAAAFVRGPGNVLPSFPHPAAFVFFLRCGILVMQRILVIQEA